MEYRLLGRLGLYVSRIAFGCMSLAQDRTYNTMLLHEAIDHGINLFDTADLYGKGQNEEMLGEAVRTKRNDIFIATKVGNEWKEDGSGWTWNPRKEYIINAVEKSLRRLQTDYIDLYQLHGGTMEDNIDESIDAFNQLQQQGKIRFYGISSIRPNVIRAYAWRSAISSVMMQYSLLDRRPEESSLELLADKQIGVLCRGSLASGLLINKPAKTYLAYSADEVKKAADSIAQISSNGRTPTGTAIHFALQDPAVTAAVIGIRTVEQLREAVSGIGQPALSRQELLSLKAAIPQSYYREHR